MSRAYLICGKICCGKTTYAARLRKEKKAVLLSVDEITLALFDQHIGEKHDEYVEKTQEYLFRKSIELLETGLDVILDWGFWMKEERDEARAFYRSHGYPCEFHYIHVQNPIWQARISARNAAILDGRTQAYYVDANLAAKFDRIFEPPSPDEIDVWITP